MAIAEITNWLNRPERIYDTGVLLFNQYSEDTLMKAFFKHGRSSYHFTKLQDELTDLNKSVVAAPQQLKKPAGFRIPELAEISVPASKHSLTDEEWVAAPNLIKDLFVEISQRKSRADLLYHQTRIEPTAEGRRRLSIAQIEDRDAINKNWAKIKEFKAKGVTDERITAATEAKVDELSVTDLFKSVNNLRSNISKDKARLSKLEPGRAFDKVAARLNENEIKLKAVQERIKNE